MDPPPPGSEFSPKVVSKLEKVGWRATMIFNLGLAAYIFASKREKDIDADKEKVVKKGKGAKKGVIITEVEKKDAEISKVADTEKAKEVESVIPHKEEEPKPDPLFEFTDAADQLVYQTAATEPVKVARKPIPEDEQRELFKWILEEKRKIEPKNKKEKKLIDEEKAILKHFIRAEKLSKFLPDDTVDSSLRDWDTFFSK